MSKRLPSKGKLIEYNTDWENINFLWDLRWIFPLSRHKTLRRQVPIGTYTLGGQVHLWLVTLLHDFTEAEVCYLDFPFVKEDVLGFDVVMDDCLGLVAEILNRR